MYTHTHTYTHIHTHTHTHTHQATLREDSLNDRIFVEGAFEPKVCASVKYTYVYTLYTYVYTSYTYVFMLRAPSASALSLYLHLYYTHTCIRLYISIVYAGGIMEGGGVLLSLYIFNIYTCSIYAYLIYICVCIK